MSSIDEIFNLTKFVSESNNDNIAYSNTNVTDHTASAARDLPDETIHYEETSMWNEKNAGKENDCQNCSIVQKKLRVSRGWNRFFKEKLINIDKILHIISDYEQEKQKNLELQLAYDQRSREWTQQQEQLISLLNEVQPLREQIKQAEKTVSEEINRRIHHQNKEQSLVVINEQLQAKVNHLSTIANAHFVETLEKKLKKSETECRKLKCDVAFCKNETEELKSHISTNQLHTDDVSKQLRWALQLIKNVNGGKSSQSEIDGEDAEVVQRLFEENKSYLEARYNSYKSNNLRKRDNPETQSFSSWVTNFNTGMEEEENHGDETVCQLEKLLTDEGKDYTLRTDLNNRGTSALDSKAGKLTKHVKKEALAKSVDGKGKYKKQTAQSIPEKKSPKRLNKNRHSSSTEKTPSKRVSKNSDPSSSPILHTNDGSMLDHSLNHISSLDLSPEDERQLCSKAKVQLSPLRLSSLPCAVSKSFSSQKSSKDYSSHSKEKIDSMTDKLVVGDRIRNKSRDSNVDGTSRMTTRSLSKNKSKEVPSIASFQRGIFSSDSEFENLTTQNKMKIINSSALCSTQSQSYEKKCLRKGNEKSKEVPGSSNENLDIDIKASAKTRMVKSRIFSSDSEMENVQVNNKGSDNVPSELHSAPSRPSGFTGIQKERRKSKNSILNPYKKFVPAKSDDKLVEQSTSISKRKAFESEVFSSDSEVEGAKTMSKRARGHLSKSRDFGISSEDDVFQKPKRISTTSEGETVTDKISFSTKKKTSRKLPYKISNTTKTSNDGIRNPKYVQMEKPKEVSDDNYTADRDKVSLKAKTCSSNLRTDEVLPESNKLDSLKFVQEEEDRKRIKQILLELKINPFVKHKIYTFSSDDESSTSSSSSSGLSACFKRKYSKKIKIQRKKLKILKSPEAAACGPSKTSGGLKPKIMTPVRDLIDSDNEMFSPKRKRKYSTVITSDDEFTEAAIGKLSSRLKSVSQSESSKEDSKVSESESTKSKVESPTSNLRKLSLFGSDLSLTSSSDEGGECSDKIHSGNDNSDASLSKVSENKNLVIRQKQGVVDFASVENIAIRNNYQPNTQQKRLMSEKSDLEDNDMLQYAKPLPNEDSLRKEISNLSSVILEQSSRCVMDAVLQQSAATEDHYDEIGAVTCDIEDEKNQSNQQLHSKDISNKSTASLDSTVIMQSIAHVPTPAKTELLDENIDISPTKKDINSLEIVQSDAKDSEVYETHLSDAKYSEGCETHLSDAKDSEVYKTHLSDAKDNEDCETHFSDARDSDVCETHLSDAKDSQGCEKHLSDVEEKSLLSGDFPFLDSLETKPTDEHSHKLEENANLRSKAMSLFYNSDSEHEVEDNSQHSTVSSSQDSLEISYSSDNEGVSPTIDIPLDEPVCTEPSSGKVPFGSLKFLRSFKEEVSLPVVDEKYPPLEYKVEDKLTTGIVDHKPLTLHQSTSTSSAYLPSFYNERTDHDVENSVPGVLESIFEDQPMTVPKEETIKKEDIFELKKSNLKLDRQYIFEKEHVVKIDRDVMNSNYLLDIFQDAVRIHASEREHFLSLMNQIIDFIQSGFPAPNIFTRLQPLIRVVLLCVLRCSPYEKTESKSPLPPTLFKLFRITRGIETRLGLRPFSVESLVSQAAHQIVIRKKLRVHSLTSLTSWVVSSCSTQSLSLPSPWNEDSLHWCRSFLVDLLYHHVGKVHEALLVVIKVSRKLFLWNAPYRKWTVLERYIHWIVTFGRWFGPKAVAQDLLVTFERKLNLKSLKEDFFASVLKEVLLALCCVDTDPDEMSLSKMTFLLMLRWCSIPLISTHFFVIFKTVYYELKMDSNKVPLNTLKETFESTIRSVPWPESRKVEFLESLRVFPIIIVTQKPKSSQT